VFAEGDRTLAVDLVLSDGTRAVGSAQVAAYSWWVDGDPVASSVSAGSATDPSLAYVWSVKGERAIDVVVTWTALLTVTYPDGTSEVTELEPVDILATRAFLVEEVQPVIDFER
jgi:hypothetical protein